MSRRVKAYLAVRVIGRPANDFARDIGNASPAADVVWNQWVSERNPVFQFGLERSELCHKLIHGRGKSIAPEELVAQQEARSEPPRPILSPVLST